MRPERPAARRRGDLPAAAVHGQAPSRAGQTTRPLFSPARARPARRAAACGAAHRGREAHAAHAARPRWPDIRDREDFGLVDGGRRAGVPRRLLPGRSDDSCSRTAVPAVPVEPRESARQKRRSVAGLPPADSGGAAGLRAAGGRLLPGRSRASSVAGRPSARVAGRAPRPAAGTGRSPVAPATSLLAGLGLITQRPGRGGVAFDQAVGRPRVGQPMGQPLQGPGGCAGPLPRSSTSRGDPAVGRCSRAVWNEACAAWRGAGRRRQPGRRVLCAGQCECVGASATDVAAASWNQCATRAAKKAAARRRSSPWPRRPIPAQSCRLLSPGSAPTSGLSSPRCSWSTL